MTVVVVLAAWAVLGLITMALLSLFLRGGAAGDDEAVPAEAERTRLLQESIPLQHAGQSGRVDGALRVQA